MGVLDAMPSSNLKPENEDAVRIILCLWFVFRFSVHSHSQVLLFLWFSLVLGVLLDTKVTAVVEW